MQRERLKVSNAHTSQEVEKIVIETAKTASKARLEIEKDINRKLATSDLPQKNLIV